jgi:hypothetical protein
LLVTSLSIEAPTVAILAPGEGVEPSLSSSKPDVLPVTPSRKKTDLVAAAGIEPTSLDYQSSALPLSYTAMVDPTGLKPAPHGLKGRCSVARAPGQKIGCGGRIRTFGDRINSAVPYQLGYATRTLAAATRVELVSSRLQDERSGAN